VLRRVLEPREKVELLAGQLATMMKPTSHRGQVLESDRDVAGPVFENGAALVLGQLPPGGRLSDRDQGGARGVRSA